jgi:hypothetical protein
MFYYTENKKPKLEVTISKEYTEADLDRVFHFIDALLGDSKIKVIFKVHPALKNKLQEFIVNRSWYPIYTYNIKDNIA